MNKQRFLIFLILIVILLCAVPSGYADKISCIMTGPVIADPDITESIPGISGEDYLLGPENAPMTIIVYGDTRCQYSRRAVLALMDFQHENPDEVLLVYRHYPRFNHDVSLGCGYAEQAAGEQGYYYDTVRYLFDNYNRVVTLGSMEELEQYLQDEMIPYLRSNGVQWDSGSAAFDSSKWEEDFHDEAMRARVNGMRLAAFNTGFVTATPTIFINGTNYTGSYDQKTLSGILAILKVQDRVFTECPDMLPDTGMNYHALLDTTKGIIDIELFADTAPLAVSSFIFLAENGWYDGNPFYQPGNAAFIMQSGDPSGSGYADAGYEYEFEYSGQRKASPGMVGMVKNSRGNNSSFFFIAADADAYYRGIYAKLALPDVEMPGEADAYVSEKLAALASNYTILGEVTPETYPVFAQITTEDVINSVTITE